MANHTHIHVLFNGQRLCNQHHHPATNTTTLQPSQCGGKLQPRMEGAVCEVFARTLRGLSGAKLTKPGAFRTSDGEAYALRCSYKVRCLLLGVWLPLGVLLGVLTRTHTPHCRGGML